MSRAEAGQLTPSRNIFVTPVIQPDGTTKRVISSDNLNENWTDYYYRMNMHDHLVPLYFLMTFMHSELNSELFIPDISRFALPFRKLPTPILTMVFAYLLPITQPSELINLGSYATAVYKPTLFSQRKMDPYLIVDAAMRGQEDMVLNILRADPSCLLKKAIIKNSVSIAYEVTALQAAVMANDIQLIERMKEYFERLPNGLDEMQQQILTIYQKSLARYPDRLPVCHDLHSVIEAHNQAQEHNTFNFQPYINVIINAPQAQLDDAIALIDAKTPEEIAAIIARTGVSPIESDEARTKPFCRLTLVEKLNHFRQKFVAHMQREIIFNPRHILCVLKEYEGICDRVNTPAVADPNAHKRKLIFSQLVGWAQRNAAEAVKQDIRQGAGYLIGQTSELRERQSFFNAGRRNAYPDESLFDSAISGIGYRFAGTQHSIDTSSREAARISSFEKVCLTKAKSFENLLLNLDRNSLTCDLSK